MSDKCRYFATGVCTCPQDIPPAPVDPDAELIAAAPDMATLLRELEWTPFVSLGSRTSYVCPACGNFEPHRHAPDCKLDALLTRIGR